MEGSHTLAPRPDTRGIPEIMVVGSLCLCGLSGPYYSIPDSTIRNWGSLCEAWGCGRKRLLQRFKMVQVMARLNGLYIGDLEGVGDDSLLRDILIMCLGFSQPLSPTGSELPATPEIVSDLWALGWTHCLSCLFGKDKKMG